MEQLAAEIEELKAKARSDAHLIELQKREIDHLADLVVFFRATRYAATSEAGHSGQKELFNEAEHTAETDGDEVEFEVLGQDLQDKKPRKRPKRKPIPEIFKRIDHIIDLPEDQKFCVHLGTPLRRVGEEVSEKIDIVPASIQVIRTIRPKYACSCGFDNCKFHIAPVPPQAIPKGNASAGFLAYIVTAKYSDHCPLNRQEGILQRAGIDLPRSTLASWMMKCGELVMPLINLMRDKILEGPLVYCDETHVQVLKGTQKKLHRRASCGFKLNGEESVNDMCSITSIPPERRR
ncbi:MAG: transposase [Chitinophagaceae bacterium]|nr:transposase [Oligoflexus sp.]